MSKARIDASHAKADGGVAELYIDGVRTPPLLYALSDIPASKAWNECSQRGIRNFGACGVQIVCVDSNLHEGWCEDGTYDPTHLYRDIEAVLKANPHAKVITRLHLNPPYFWLRAHRSELLAYTEREQADGRTVYKNLPLTDSGEYGERTIARKHLFSELRASIGSPVWINDVCSVLRQLCEKVKAHPLGEALIGIQVANGHCGEWHMWARSDYGEAMNGLYRRMLCKIYPDLALFHRRYGKDATPETVSMATAEEMDRPFLSERVLDRDRYAHALDSMRAFSYASAEAISAFASCIKKAWGREMMVGAFYCYFFSTGGPAAAHFEIDRILDNPDIDFLAAPSAYGNNKKSGNLNFIRYVAESCRLHGKLMLAEMDQGYRSVNQAEKNLYVCESEEEYASLMKRNIMENIILGNGAWYYDHRVIPSDIHVKEEYWNNEERLHTVKVLQETCQKLLEKPFKKTTDVLLVVDAKSKLYTKQSELSFEMINALGKSGVGFDRLYLSDLAKCDISRYRAVIFHNCLSIERQTYDFICEKVMADGRAVILAGGFGLVIEDEDASKKGEAFIDLENEKCHIVVMEKASTDASLYREIFRRAGAHIYADKDEVIIADNELVMIHCRDREEATLHLQNQKITFPCAKFETRVYHTVTGERIL